VEAQTETAGRGRGMGRGGSGEEGQTETAWGYWAAPNPNSEKFWEPGHHSEKFWEPPAPPSTQGNARGDPSVFGIFFSANPNPPRDQFVSQRSVHTHMDTHT
jgi:hypothetical protein